jgi:hypothetical protein
MSKERSQYQLHSESKETIPGNTVASICVVFASADLYTKFFSKHKQFSSWQLPSTGRSIGFTKLRYILLIWHYKPLTEPLLRHH